MDDFNIQILFNVIKNNNCVTKNCENEVTQLNEMINKHNDFCYYRRVYYSEYKFDKSKILLQKREICSRSYTIKTNDYFEIIEKRFP